MTRADTFSVDAGSITIIYPDHLSVDDIDWFEEFMALWFRSVRRKHAIKVLPCGDLSFLDAG